MQLCHTTRAISARFDDPNLLSAAGLVPVVALACSAGLGDLADQHLSVPTDKGANAGSKVVSLVAGMVAGADSIDDLALLRHGGMGRVFNKIYAPSTLGSFLRSFTFGHVRQLDAIASRFLVALGQRTPMVPGPHDPAQRVLVDIDDTLIRVYGHSKQGAGFGYTGVRGINVLLGTATMPGSAPVVVGQRLRKGSAGSPRGAKQFVRATLGTVGSLTAAKPLVRADSAFYGRPTVLTAVAAGADVSVTVRLDAKVRAAIAGIDQDAWTTIEYPDAVFDDTTGRWISRAEVAEVAFTAFVGQRKDEELDGRLVVRRIPDFQATGQGTLFDTWRFHAFFTTTDPDQMDTVTADQTHRQHAIIEQVHADLKNGPLAHLPCRSFTANAAWLVLAVIAFNLTRALAASTGPRLARATTATIRRTLITVPARVATSARRITLHLPDRWPWQHEWHRSYQAARGSPATMST